MTDLSVDLAAASQRVQVGGREFCVLPQAAAEKLAKGSQRSRREVERAALTAGIIPGRYLRNVGTVGISGQLRLLNATVAVVGCGGLGGLVVELLARMGVGTLVLVDGDVFEDNNLNRQLLCTEADLGKPKVMAAYERVLAINAAVEVRCHETRLTKENAAFLLGGADVVVDALDNLPSRFVLERAARRLQIPLVHGAIAGFLGQVLTIYPDDPGLAELYGPEGSRERGVEVETGNPAATPALVAAYQAQEVVKILTGAGEPLRRRLLYIDSAGGEVYTLNLGERGKEEQKAAGTRQGPAVVSFVGTSGSGKTTLLVELITALTRRGLKVAAVKHSHEENAGDAPGKDTQRLKQAGAEGVALLTPARTALFYPLADEEAGARLTDWFPGVDLILVEGWKHGPFPRVLVFRAGVSEPLSPPPPDTIAVVGDVAAARAAGLPADRPGFGWEEVEELGEFLMRTFRVGAGQN
ncbi:molybdopterin-guanine dinucleotide biosynthesis protein B [Gelria sp. Kuro-4]|uniref:molybdopterin-guanine dinucleotide biosynthesis protein B n=1 Tax=Gelria sp. Kuro-4 TaxID=2796927 RepID=UPI001BF0A716|nr:molybdopterin-guanine dinucleotide biosynthesis protein B [Gelria sp. Kuro-4]BCV23570.1 hypothetical protein kuro4_03430 [Gelria sp. Kuro-4]